MSHKKQNNTCPIRGGRKGEGADLLDGSRRGSKRRNGKGKHFVVGLPPSKKKKEKKETMLSRLGFALRETGQALDRLGCRLRGSEVYLEESELMKKDACPLRNRREEERIAFWAVVAAAVVAAVAARGGPLLFRFPILIPSPTTPFTSSPIFCTLLDKNSKQNLQFRSVYRHRTIQPVASSMPSTAAAAFIAPSATVAGDVRLGDRVSVWFGAVIRGACGDIWN